jgi:Dos2-interacting transcription regulator of RNA-Pol-II
MLRGVSLLQSLLPTAVVEAAAETLFDVVACYYPITFTPPPGNPHGVTAEVRFVEISQYTHNSKVACQAFTGPDCTVIPNAIMRFSCSTVTRTAAATTLQYYANYLLSLTVLTTAINAATAVPSHCSN